MSKAKNTPESTEQEASVGKDVNTLLAEAQAKVAELEAVVDSQNKIIEDLNSELAKVSEESAKKDKHPVIKVGKEQYVVKAKKFLVSKGGKNITCTPESLAQDPELVKYLIEKKSGLLVKKGA